MNNNKEKNAEKKTNTIWTNMVYFICFIIIAVICYYIYNYFFNNNSKIKNDISGDINVNIKNELLSDLNVIVNTDVNVNADVNVNVNADVNISDINNNLIELDTITDNIEIPLCDFKLKTISHDYVSNIDKINELFDNFE